MSEKRFTPKSITQLLTNLFIAAGYQKPHAKLMADSLVTTSLRGTDSHGIRLTPHYVKAMIAGRINKKPHFKFKNTAPGVSIMDADHAHGIIAGTAAMKQAMSNARRAGIGAVAVQNSTHFAAAAIYSIPVAEENMIGLCFTHAEALMAPHGGSKGFFGTNPICFAAPCAGEEPFCLDMATSSVTRNRVMYCKENGLTLEDGCTLDADGVVTTDPHKVAAFIPFGTYKGYGLATMVEIFSSLLSGMAFGPFVSPMLPVSAKKRQLGQFFMAIDIKRFQSVPTFKRRLKQMMNLLRAQKPAKGFSKVLVAGDPEKISFAERSKKGIPVGKDLFNNFNLLCRQLKVKNVLRRLGK